MKYNVVAFLTYCCCYYCSITAACSNSATPRTAKHQTPHSSNISQSFLKFMSLSQWCDLTISSSIPSSSFCLQSFPASRSFPVSSLFTSGGASDSAIVLSMNIQHWFSLRLTSLISLQSKGLLRLFSSTTIQKYQFFDDKPSLWSTLTSVHGYWEKM